jgi:hypothetical protein
LCFLPVTMFAFSSSRMKVVCDSCTTPVNHIVCLVAILRSSLHYHSRILDGEKLIFDVVSG